MPYQLKHSRWIRVQADKVSGVLMQNMDVNQTYTVGDLLDLCANLGLEYTLPVYAEIGVLLVADGILDVV